MKKPASVHIDIAEFAMTVMEISESERSEWLLSLVKCLSYADPSLNLYGAKLLGEVEQYREAERLRKEKYKEKEEPKGETRKDTERQGKTVFPKSDTTEQTEQSRQTEQTKEEEKEHECSKKKQPKKSFGLNGMVKLSEDEYNKLVVDYGKSALDDKILDFENYLNKGNTYKDHNLAIRNWFRKESGNKSFKPKQTGLFGNNFAEQRSELTEAIERRKREDEEKAKMQTENDSLPF